MSLRYVLLLLLLAGCGSASSEPPSPRLYLPGDGELWVVDTAGPSVRHEVRKELGPGDPPYRVITRQNRLVLLGVPPFDDGSFFLPSARTDRLWTVRLDPHDARVSTVREVTVDGRVTVPDARPPYGSWPLAGVGEGLLVDDRAGGIAVWDPVEGAVVRRLDIDPGSFGTTSGDLVASCADEQCTVLRLTDAHSGAARSLPAPEGTRFEPWAAAFSPDGKRLGIALREPGGRARLGLVEDGELTLVPDASVPPGYTFVVWTPSGDHVFITGGERFQPRTLVGYRLGSPRAEPIDVTVGDFYGAAAL